MDEDQVAFVAELGKQRTAAFLVAFHFGEYGGGFVDDL